MTSGTTPFLLISLLWIAACGISDRGVPETTGIVSADSIITEKAMIHIIADVQIIESALLLERNRGQEPGNLSGQMYQKLFDQYGISRSIYERSIRHYQSDQAHFSLMYEAVIQRIEIQIDSLKKADSAGR